MAVEAGGIGARLRAGREKLGLTVLQVAERIHTDAKIVEAIEAESFEALGAPVYARGHIGHYAELVGESGSELNQLYSHVSKVAQPDLTRIVKVPAGTNSSKLVAPALLVIAVFAVAGAIWWVSALSKKTPQLSDTHVVGEEAPTAAVPGSGPSPPAPGSEPTQEPTPAGLSPVAADRGAPPGAMAMQGQANSGAEAGAASRSGTTGSGAAAKPTLSRPGTTGSGAATTAAAPRSRNAGSGGPVSPAPRSGTTGSSASAGASAPQRLAAAAPSHATNQSQITLRYSADSWTEVYDASGARLFYDVGAANSVQTVVGTPPLRVVLGNAPGVSVEYNGHSKPISKLSRPDGSVQFSINRSGQVVRAKPGADGG
jgi:cytoskeleton protein RodZ